MTGNMTDNMAEKNRPKRNSWKSKSFNTGSRSYLPQPLTASRRGTSTRDRTRDKDVMIPRNSHHENRPRKTRFFDSLRRGKKGGVPEDEIPTKDGYDSAYEQLQQFHGSTPDSMKSRGEPSSITTSQLFETDNQESMTVRPYEPRRLSRSKSYVIGE